jgi:hypothetical protein
MVLKRNKDNEIVGDLINNRVFIDNHFPLLNGNNTKKNNSAPKHSSVIK